MRRAFKRREAELDSLIFQVQAQATQAVRYDCGAQTDMEALQYDPNLGPSSGDELERHVRFKR